jgi:hypothetical protein
MREVFAYTLVAICAGVVGWVIGTLLRGTVRGVDVHDWRNLKSGTYRGYGRGVDGFVSYMTSTPYWWVTKSDRTIIEGHAKSIVAAKQEADEAAEWLLRK